MTACARCGIRFRGEGLCGICRIEIREKRWISIDRYATGNEREP